MRYESPSGVSLHRAPHLLCCEHLKGSTSACPPRRAVPCEGFQFGELQHWGLANPVIRYLQGTSGGAPGGKALARSRNRAISAAQNASDPAAAGRCKAPDFRGRRRARARSVMAGKEKERRGSDVVHGRTPRPFRLPPGGVFGGGQAPPLACASSC